MLVFQLLLTFLKHVVPLFKLPFFTYVYLQRYKNADTILQSSWQAEQNTLFLKLYITLKKLTEFQQFVCQLSCDIPHFIELTTFSI
jgi:hypothetical protein